MISIVSTYEEVYEKISYPVKKILELVVNMFYDDYLLQLIINIFKLLHTSTLYSASTSVPDRFEPLSSRFTSTTWTTEPYLFFQEK